MRCAVFAFLVLSLLLIAGCQRDLGTGETAEETAMGESEEVVGPPVVEDSDCLPDGRKYLTNSSGDDCGRCCSKACDYGGVGCGILPGGEGQCTHSYTCGMSPL